MIIEAKSQRYKGTLWTRITFLSIFFLPAPETATFGVKIEKKLNFDHRRKKLSINQKVYGYFEAQWHFCLLCLSVRKACLLPLFSPLTKFAPSSHPKLSIPLTKLVNLHPSFRSHHKASPSKKKIKIRLTPTASVMLLLEVLVTYFAKNVSFSLMVKCPFMVELSIPFGTYLINDFCYEFKQLDYRYHEVNWSEYGFSNLAVKRCPPFSIFILPYIYIQKSLKTHVINIENVNCHLVIFNITPKNWWFTIFFFHIALPYNIRTNFCPNPRDQSHLQVTI